MESEKIPWWDLVYLNRSLSHPEVQLLHRHIRFLIFEVCNRQLVSESDGSLEKSPEGEEFNNVILLDR